MLNKLFIGFIFCLPFFLSGQNWKINTVVFGGDFLTQINKDQILISNNSKGFWKSDVFGENFFTKIISCKMVQEFSLLILAILSMIN
jgi:hypothetical protein